MTWLLRSRLCLMMFVNYFVWGAWYGTLNTYLTQTLHFSGTQAGLIFGTVALSCILSPFFVGLIADRFLATEKTLALMHVFSAATMVAASRVTSFEGLYAAILAHCIFFMPSVALTNTLAMRQMTDAGREFPFVRMFGTFGWIAIGWVIALMKVEASAVQFLVSAAASVVMAGYSLTLPHTPPRAAVDRVSVRAMLGLDALAMLRDRSFAVLAVSAFLACIPLTFYFSFTNPYLNELGIENAAGKMTYGQVAEVAMMLIMPWVFRKVPVKGILVAGLAAWAARYALFAAGDAGGNLWMLLLAIALHGICYDFFFMTAQIYTDQEAPRHLRGAAQGFIQFVTYGVGMFAGSILSGVAVDAFTVGGVRNWGGVWGSAGAASAVILLLVTMLFRSSKKIQAQAAA
jgi:nucleoside transporter